MRVGELLPFGRTVLRGFVQDECLSMAAALAYYTVFSLAPMLVVVVAVTGAVFTPEQATAWVDDRLRWLVGPDGAELVGVMVAHVRDAPGQGAVARVLGAVTAAFGATAVVVQLQASLNRSWNVRLDPARGGIRRWIVRRAVSLAMVAGLSALVVVSIATSTALAAALDRAGSTLHLRSGLPAASRGLEFTASFLALSAAFAAVFKVLPDVRIRWVDVAVGAVVTALLFTVGKSAIGVYLAHSRIATAYGGASSFAVLLVWVYYSWAVVLFGAELTQAWTHRFGGGMHPVPGARVVD